MTKAIIIKDNYELSSANQMTDMSVVLKDHVIKQKLFTNIQGKNYVHTDGWQYAGGLMGLYPRITSVENLSNGNEIKWKADVEVVRLTDDKVVGKGFAICSNKESKKKMFDEYAILSMAQTRAIGKAYRNLIGWVMKLAGYESTPTEEMTKVGDNISMQAQAPSPIKTQTTAPKTTAVKLECHSCAEVIPKVVYDYSKKVYKRPLCRNCQPKRK